MKKYYESRDLHAVLRHSQIRKKYDLSTNIFIPSDIIEAKKAFEKLEIIEDELKKLTNEDIRKSNFNKIDSSILNTNLFVTISHSFQEPGFAIIPFIECNFDNFIEYFSFFISFGFLTIVSQPKLEETKKFELLSEYSLKDLLLLAYEFYKKDKKSLQKFQKEYIETIEFLFNLNNENNFKGLSPKNLFFIYEFMFKDNKGIFKYRRNLNILYNLDDLSAEVFNTIKFTNNKLENAKLVAKKIKELSHGNKINLEYGKTYLFSSIFEFLYVDLLLLLDQNTTLIKKCKCCNKYFLTNKSNAIYCDRIQNKKTGQTCKDIGADIVALRNKRNDSILNLKASIASKKAMDVKRHPDIVEYKVNYDNWKPLALKYLKEYKNGNLDATTFEKWLNYTSNEKISSKFKTIDEFKE